YDVSREYYVNDTGKQMDLLGESVFASIKGEPVPEDGYKGEYISELAQKLKDCLSAQECTEKAGAMMLEGHISVLKKFRVNYDSIFPESDLIKNNRVVEIVNMLKDKGLTYEKDGALWFKSTEYGDDRDRVLKKNDGSLTYFAADCAYHMNKASRFEHLVNIWGADHHGYVPRVQAFWEASGLAQENNLDVILYQLVDLKKAGEKVSMSTRQGEFVTLEEVIDEVGADATRFFMLMRSGDSPLEFDLDLAKKQNKTNPVYYVQYSHARIASVFRKVGISPEEVDINTCTLGEEEKDVLKILAHFPYILSKCVELSAPHLLIEYLREAATAFHKYYDRVRVIGSGDMLNTRLMLLAAFKGIIAGGLELIGVSAPERM
ncbi:MAG: arginine--tRNA ligase, partial [Elusimicrobia bacterium]|nr:arginine--tRNA ligase [Elusimicrobiota bacterium]